MPDLTLDTSTDPSFLFLSEGKIILALRFLTPQNNLSKVLVPSIEEVFSNTPYKLQDVKRIFVGTGPGSYSGVRVGVATAASLALGLDVPLYPFCSLLGFIPKNLPEGPFSFLLHSAGGAVFLLKGTSRKNEIDRCLTEKIMEENDLKSEPEPGSVLISLNPEKLKKKLDFLGDLEGKLFKGEPNPTLLLSHLSRIGALAPPPPTVSYLYPV